MYQINIKITIMYICTYKYINIYLLNYRFINYVWFLYIACICCYAGKWKSPKVIFSCYLSFITYSLKLIYDSPLLICYMHL